MDRFHQGRCVPMEMLTNKRFLSTAELYRADEIFLTGTTTEVLPIVHVDGNPVGHGRIGPISKKLY